VDVFAVNNFGDTRSGGLAGPMGLFLIVLMCIATVLLIRNMNKRIRRLPDSFPNPAAPGTVAEIASGDGDTGRSAPAARPDVETDRSAQAAASKDAEVEDVAAGDKGDEPGAGKPQN
jgi:hypothetical protein